MHHAQWVTFSETCCQKQNQCLKSRGSENALYPILIALFRVEGYVIWL